MKVLGIKQFHQMSFKLLDLKGSKFDTVLGNIPKNFIAVVYGFSGNGKTEFCMQLAKYLCEKHGSLAWLSYEQRHGSDLQQATVRNKMDDVTGKFYPIDPMANLEAGVSLLEDLDNYLQRRGSPDFIVIDSIDYTGFGWEDYKYLKLKYGKKKGFIFISHSQKNGKLKKAIAEQIMFDGGLGIFVSKYIATPEKNRYGGFEPYVVYEERARLLNPLFFEKRVKAKGTPKKEGKSPDNVMNEVGNLTEKAPEARGVRAKN